MVVFRCFCTSNDNIIAPITLFSQTFGNIGMTTNVTKWTRPLRKCTSHPSAKDIQCPTRIGITEILERNCMGKFDLQGI